MTIFLKKVFLRSDTLNILIHLNIFKQEREKRQKEREKKRVIQMIKKTMIMMIEKIRKIAIIKRRRKKTQKMKRMMTKQIAKNLKTNFKILKNRHFQFRNLETNSI